MDFNLDAIMADILATPVATVATPATNGPNVAKIAGVAAHQPRATKPPEVLPFTPPPLKGVPMNPMPSRDDRDAFRHGHAFGDRTKTWTGRVVSLDEWRNLSAWDRHGPDGCLWCGICQGWVASFPECHSNAA